MSLAIGTDIVEITFGNGNRTRYTERDLPSLRSLRSLIQAEIGDVPKRAYARNGGRASR